MRDKTPTEMADIVTRLRRWAIATDAAPASDLMDEAADAVESLRREVREQRKEIAAMREERRALLDADRPMCDRPEAINTGESDRPKAINIDARLAALEQLTALDEELGLPRTPNPHATPAECRLLPGCTETGRK